MHRAYAVNGVWLSHDEKAIGRTKVLLTLLDGREVFRDPSFKD